MSKNTNKPIISVVIPVFNTENYLTKCLDSIINQSIKDIEIIITNDMSTDNSEKVILDFVNKYDFIKYFKMQSKGLAGGTRNLGLSKVSGKYIGFVDSDDWVDTTMFEKMIYALDKYDADIAVCGVITEHDKPLGSDIRYEYLFENVLEGKKALELLSSRKTKDSSISAIVCNKVYRTKFIKENNHTFLINNHNDDDVFNFICFLTASKVVIVPDTYYHYYQRKDSIMHVFLKKYIDDLIAGFITIKKYLVMNNIYELHKEEYYSFFDKCLASILNILISSENNPKKQTEAINYLISNCQEALIPYDYIDTISIQRIIQFLTSAI